MKKIESILNSIIQRSILSDVCFSNKDFDAILDLRDENPFDQDWITSYKKIEKAWANHNASNDLIELIEKVCKESFLVTSQSTDQHEIASYVSDDFDLIAKYLALNVKDSFVSSLLSTYLKDRLPKGE
ncbi:hypothetical protein [Desulfoluna butyratoxydans]|uniref:hypothetical protein n=1 Tax=Desulfoluna butyratoxydans TaxID=231438 RepID=UPI0015D0F617|nr:hypothetical protein [Desulfoluna butyratoxydans]